MERIPDNSSTAVITITIRNRDHKKAVIFIVLRAHFYGWTWRGRTAFRNRNRNFDNLINDSILQIFLRFSFTRSCSQQQYFRKEVKPVSENNSAICEDGKSRLRRARSIRSIFDSRRTPLHFCGVTLFTHAKPSNFGTFLIRCNLLCTATHSYTRQISHNKRNSYK